MTLAEVLIDEGVITKEQAAEADRRMSWSGCKFGEALVAMGVLTRPQVEVFVGEQQRRGATSLFAKSRAVLRMTRAVAQSTAQRSQDSEPSLLDRLRLRDIG